MSLPESLPQSLPQSLPSLCEYAGVPSIIAFDAPVTERYDLLVRWCSLCKFDYDCLPCVLVLQMQVRESVYEYIRHNILRLIDWSICDFETFRSELLEMVEISACWATLPAVQWLDYAAETSGIGKPRELSLEEIAKVQEVVESL
jgi:hypothetical protein